MRRRVATVPAGASTPQLPAGPVPEPRARSRSVLLALGLFAVTCVVAAASPWTARDAVATALRQSPDAEAARHRLEASEAMRQQAESAWKPQLTITGGYIQTNNALTALSFTLNQRNFGFDLNFNRPGWVDDLNVVGTLGYNLYSGGQATARRNAAHAGSRAAGHDLRAVQLQLTAEVLKAMLSVHKARESVASLEASVKSYQANVANARLRFTAGQTLKADLLSLEVQLARTQEMLAAGRHRAALAARAFVFVLGLDPSDQPVELAQNDPDLTALSLPDTTNFSQRPELRSLEERLRMSEALVAAARAGRRPNVNAYVAGQYDQGWVFDRQGESLQGGVVVDFNVFDGGRTSGRIRQAMAELAQVKDQLRKTTLGIGFEVEQARLAHADVRERLAVTTSAVAQAEESATLSRERFQKGALLTAELIGSESRLVEMQMLRTIALADERIALIELHRALGLPPIAPP